MNIFELVGLEERALKMKERVVEKIVEYASGIYYGHNYAKLDPTDIPIPENIYTKDFYDKSLKNIEKLDRNACQKGYNEAIEMFRSKGSNYVRPTYVGMILSKSSTSSGFKCSPHVCGDDSKAYTIQVYAHRFAPRMWG